jgi:hypothetical protein
MMSLCLLTLTVSGNWVVTPMLTWPWLNFQDYFVIAAIYSPQSGSNVQGEPSAGRYRVGNRAKAVLL